MPFELWELVCELGAAQAVAPSATAASSMRKPNRDATIICLYSAARTAAGKLSARHNAADRLAEL